jgi:hypothetical protein
VTSSNSCMDEIIFFKESILKGLRCYYTVLHGNFVVKDWNLLHF